MDIPVIFSKTVYNRTINIRPYSKDDIQPLYEAATESVDLIYPWLDWCHPGYKIEESYSWVMSREHNWLYGIEYSFVIEDGETKKFLGSCALNQINKKDKVANLGYWIRLSETGKGICPAAAGLLVDFGFHQLKLNRIEIIIAVDNKASQRVAEKIGGFYEGILRHRIVTGNKIHDAKIYSLINSNHIFP